MLQKLPQSTGNVFGYEARGRITDQEFTAFADEFAAAIARHGKVRLLVYLPELPWLDPVALWENLKLARYRNDLDRYALVSDSPVIELSSRFVDILSAGDVRQFGTARLDEAWDWLREPVDGS